MSISTSLYHWVRLRNWLPYFLLLLSSPLLRADRLAIRPDTLPHGGLPVDTTLDYPATAIRVHDETFSRFGYYVPERGYVVAPEFEKLAYTYDSEGMIATREGKDILIDGYGRPLSDDYLGISPLFPPADFPMLYVAQGGDGQYLLNARGQPFTPVARFFPATYFQLYNRRFISIQPKDEAVRYFYDLCRDSFLLDEPVVRIDVLRDGWYVARRPCGEVFVFNEARDRTLDGEYDAYDLYTYSDPDEPHELLLVERKGKFGLVHPDGREVLDPVYRSITVRPPWAIVRNDEGKKGLFHLAGGWVLECQFDKLKYSQGEAYFPAARRDRGVGAYNLAGDPILPLEFRRVLEVRHDRIQAFGWSDVGQLYDLKGRRLSEEFYYEINRITDHLAWVKGFSGLDRLTERQLSDLDLNDHPEKYALLDLNTGRRLTGYIYDRIRATTQSRRDVITVDRDGYRGTVNSAGLENNDFRPIEEGR